MFLVWVLKVIPSLESCAGDEASSAALPRINSPSTTLSAGVSVYYGGQGTHPTLHLGVGRTTFPQLSTDRHNKQGSFSNTVLHEPCKQWTLRACLDWGARKKDLFWNMGEARGRVSGIHSRTSHIEPGKLKSSKLRRYKIWSNKPLKHDVRTETLNTLNVHFCSWEGSCWLCSLHTWEDSSIIVKADEDEVGHHMGWGIAEVWEIPFCLHFTFLLENYPPATALGSPQGQSAQDCLRQRETRQVVEKPSGWPKQAKEGHIWWRA